jgi:hypothetical protein
MKHAWGIMIYVWLIDTRSFKIDDYTSITATSPSYRELLCHKTRDDRLVIIGKGTQKYSVMGISFFSVNMT